MSVAAGLVAAGRALPSPHPTRQGPVGPWNPSVYGRDGGGARYDRMFGARSVPLLRPAHEGVSKGPLPFGGRAREGSALSQSPTQAA
jgi:hypothetical protein